MPIIPRKTEQLPETRKDFTKSLKLQTPGDYVCEMVDTRMNPENDRFNESYYFDFKVLSGPAYIGEEAHVCKYPADAKGGRNKKTGQVFGAKQAREKDEVRVQQWLAACYGLDWSEAGELAEGGKLEGKFAECFTGEAADSRAKGSSPVAGRKVLVRCKSNGLKGAEEKFYSDILPLKGNAAKTEAASPAKTAAASPAAKPATKPPLPKSAAKPSFEQAASAAGYQFHEDLSPEYMVRMLNGEAVETVYTVDVQSQLGYDPIPF